MSISEYYTDLGVVHDEIDCRICEPEQVITKVWVKDDVGEWVLVEL